MRTFLLGEEGESVDALYHWRYFDTGIGIDNGWHILLMSLLHGILVARSKGVRVVGR